MLTYPLLLITPLAWICVPVAIVAAILLALYLRPRYRLAILDSSPLGVFSGSSAGPEAQPTSRSIAPSHVIATARG